MLTIRPMREPFIGSIGGRPEDRPDHIALRIDEARAAIKDRVDSVSQNVVIYRALTKNPGRKPGFSS